MLFLGIDVSTQGVKCVICDAHLRVLLSDSVQFEDIPGFRGESCLTKRADGTVTQPAQLFFAALDTLLLRMKDRGAPLSRIAAIAGSGQQHGSVYWQRGAADVLAGLDSRKADIPLASLLSECVSFADCPIWMDSSTATECAAIQAAAGGAEALAALTGSRAYERFTLSQMLKRARSDPAAWAATGAVSLISSALASVLAGRIVPIDAADGSGMNLLDLGLDAGCGLATSGSGAEACDGLQWSSKLLDAFRDAAPGLADKLQQPVPSHTSFGRIAPYFCARYGFSTDCSVIAWSGDNPCSLAGLGLQAEGDVAVSLGTSDTLFAVVPRSSAHPGLDGHLFASPVDPLPPLGRGSLMALLCFKNGSLTRERVRNAAAGGSWGAFNAALAATDSQYYHHHDDCADDDVHGSVSSVSRGATAATADSAAGHRQPHGRIGIYWDLPAITPSTARSGDFRFERVAAAGLPLEAGADSAVAPAVGSDSDGSTTIALCGERWAPVESFSGAAVSGCSTRDAAPAGLAWNEADVRAVVEGRFLAMRLHAELLGLSGGGNSGAGSAGGPGTCAGAGSAARGPGVRRVIATGGASANMAILQVLADVFGAPVYTAESANSAAVGAALRAAHSWACAQLPPTATAAAAATSGGGTGRPGGSSEASEGSPAVGSEGSASGFIPFEAVLRHGVTPALFEAAGAPVPEAVRAAALSTAVAAAAASPAAAGAGSDSASAATRSSAAGEGTTSALNLTLAASPRPAAHAAYSAMLPVYAACEARAVELTRAE